MSKGSFARGVGQWVGAAEVYDADGRFAGTGHDTRTVMADDQMGRVTVEVEFDGPFKLSGAYAIADHGTHRAYEGPLNVGYAEVLSDGLVAAHNYWPDLGLSQRFFLMVLPDGTRQLSLALLSRGDRLRWTVVGEYQRRLDPSAPPLPPVAPMDPEELRDDPTAGRGQALLLRSGRWSGSLHRLGADLEPLGTVDYEEAVTEESANKPARAASSGISLFEVGLAGIGFAPDASFTLLSDGWAAWTPPGEVVGSGGLSGGRGFSGQFHHRHTGGDTGGFRVWRREVASLEGTTKAVLHTWYRGEQRIGAAHGVLAFNPA